MHKDENPFNILEDDLKAEDGSIGFFARIRGYFLAGILVTAPISITIYLTWVFLQFVDSRVTPLIPAPYNPNTYLPFSMPGIGLIVAIAAFILIGWFAKNILGRVLIRIAEYIVHRVPVIRTIYKAIKQIFETIMASQSQAFREVVLLEYPRKGVWSMGFVTGRTEGEVQRTTEEETMSVFVPTTPNPTSGYLLFVPKKELYWLDMTVEEAAKLVVSAGIITPPDRTIGEYETDKGAIIRKDEKDDSKSSTGEKKKSSRKKPAGKKKKSAGEKKS